MRGCCRSVMPWPRLLNWPNAIDDRTAAGMMLQGMTVEYLTRRTFKGSKGDTVRFHAAAGGVGLIACQWLSHIGATVIGTVGSEEKAALAKAHGCHHTINYREENFVERVKDLTDGKGVPVVYDSVGKDTFDGSLDCLKPRGMMVLFGAASGPAPAVDPNRSEEHTSELQSLMRISYAVFCLKSKTKRTSDSRRPSQYSY